jgi:hypothetical protein
MSAISISRSDCRENSSNSFTIAAPPEERISAGGEFLTKSGRVARIRNASSLMPSPCPRSRPGANLRAPGR